MECWELIEKTGGLVFNEEEFDSQVFKASINKYFDHIVSDWSVYGAKMLINHSKEVFFNGFLGPGKLINK